MLENLDNAQPLSIASKNQVLIFAVRKGNFEQVQNWVNRGADILAKDYSNHTANYYAENSAKNETDPSKKQSYSLILEWLYEQARLREMEKLGTDETEKYDFFQKTVDDTQYINPNLATLPNHDNSAFSNRVAGITLFATSKSEKPDKLIFPKDEPEDILPNFTGLPINQ